MIAALERNRQTYTCTVKHVEYSIRTSYVCNVRVEAAVNIYHRDIDVVLLFSFSSTQMMIVQSVVGRLDLSFPILQLVRHVL
jgi:hypothetical protein